MNTIELILFLFAAIAGVIITIGMILLPFLLRRILDTLKSIDTTLTHLNYLTHKNAQK
jgi:ABC-type molybdate transport system permease subunit